MKQSMVVYEVVNGKVNFLGVQTLSADEVMLINNWQDNIFAVTAEKWEEVKKVSVA